MAAEKAAAEKIAAEKAAEKAVAEKVAARTRPIAFGILAKYITCRSNGRYQYCSNVFEESHKKSVSTPTPVQLHVQVQVLTLTVCDGSPLES